MSTAARQVYIIFRMERNLIRVGLCYELARDVSHHGNNRPSFMLPLCLHPGYGARRRAIGCRYCYRSRDADEVAWMVADTHTHTHMQAVAVGSWIRWAGMPSVITDFTMRSFVLAPERRKGCIVCCSVGKEDTTSFLFNHNRHSLNQCHWQGTVVHGQNYTERFDVMA